MTGREKVLDVGSGIGNDVAVIAHKLNRGGQIIAIDISKSLLGLTYQRTRNTVIRPSYVLASACALTFNKNSFDIVLAKHVLNHVGDINLALAEIVRVIKRTGTAVITTGVKTKDDDLLRVKHQEVIQRLGLKKEVRLSRVSFTCENARGYLKHFFNNIDYHYYSFQMVFLDVNSFMLYYTTLPCFQEAGNNTKDKIKIAALMRELLNHEAKPIILDRSRGTFICKNKIEERDR